MNEKAPVGREHTSMPKQGENMPATADAQASAGVTLPDPIEVKKQVATFQAEFDKTYFDLSDEIANEGVAPNDVPAWKEAVRLRDTFKDHLTRFEHAYSRGDTSAQERWYLRLKELEAALRNGVSDRAGQEVTEILAMRADAHAEEGGGLPQAAPDESLVKHALRGEAPETSLRPSLEASVKKLSQRFDDEYSKIEKTLRNEGFEPDEVEGWPNVALLRRSFQEKKEELEKQSGRDEQELYDMMASDYDTLRDAAANTVYESMRAMRRTREEAEAIEATSPEASPNDAEFADELKKKFDDAFFEAAGKLQKEGLEPLKVEGWGDAVLLRREFLAKKEALESHSVRNMTLEQATQDKERIRDAMTRYYSLLRRVTAGIDERLNTLPPHPQRAAQAAGEEAPGDKPEQEAGTVEHATTRTPGEIVDPLARRDLAESVAELAALSASQTHEPPPQEKAEALDMKTAEGRAEKLGLWRAREALLESEKLLIEKEQEFVKNHSKIGRGVRSLFGTKKVQELQSLQAEVDRRAHQYHSGIETSLAKRLEEKGYGALGFKGKEGEGRVRTEELIARYRSRVEARDVVERGEDRREQAREEAIGEKSPLAFEKLVSYLSTANHALEEKLGGKTRARLVRLAAVGSLTGIVGVATGGLAFGVVLASSKVGRGALGWALGTGAGAGAGALYEKTGGARARTELQSARTRASSGVEGIADLRKKYRSGSEEAIARKRAKWETYTQLLTAAAVGVGGSAFSHEMLMHVAGMPNVQVPPVRGHEAFMVSPSTGHEAVPLPGEARGVTPAISEIPNTPPADALPEMPAAPRVDTNFSVHATPGDGYERMLGKLADAAKGHATADQFPPGSDAYKLLSADPHARAGLLDELAKKHAMLHTDGRSGIVGLSDSLRFDASGNVHLVGPGHPDFVDAPQNYPTTPALHTVDHAAASHAGPPSALETQATAERVQAWHAAHPGLDAVAPNVDAAGAVHDPSDVLAHNAVQASSAPSPESFVNAHAVTIDPNIPRVYGAADGKLYAYGGTYTDRLAVATTHVEAHGGRVLIEAEKPALVDGRPHRYFVEVRKPRLFGLWQGAQTTPLPVVSDAERYLNQSNAAFTSQFTSIPQS